MLLRLLGVIRFFIVKPDLLLIIKSAQFSFTALLFPHSPAYAKTDETCLGSERAEVGVMYLHGLELDRPSNEEKHNRKVLKAWAERRNLRVSLPRSPFLCGKKACWPREPEDALDASLAAAQKASGQCLGNRRLQMILGFSNGGYLVNRHFLRCQRRMVSLVSFGAAGPTTGTDLVEPIAGSQCDSLIVVAAREELTFRDAKKFSEFWSKKSLPVKFRSFTGKHGLDLETLGDL